MHRIYKWMFRFNRNIPPIRQRLVEPLLQCSLTVLDVLVCVATFQTFMD